jgi:hypothetical protein
LPAATALYAKQAIPMPIIKTKGFAVSLHILAAIEPKLRKHGNSGLPRCYSLPIIAHCIFIDALLPLGILQNSWTLPKHP